MTIWLISDDEIRSRVRHSQEYFNQVLEDMDDYDEFCRIDIDFKNNKAVLAEKRIKEVYERCLEENDFL